MLNNNKLIVPGVESALDQMKQEIAAELNIVPGADTSSRLNGKIGGTMTARLVEMAKNQLQ